MKIVISPAKSLDFEKPIPKTTYSEALFLTEAERLNQLLRKKSPRALKKLMNISDNLAELNYQRNQEWSLPFDSSNARPAIYTFNGEAYRGVDIGSLPQEHIDTLQGSLRILSGLYGLLKPLDLIQAYRLEMGTRFPVGVKKNLYEFWKEKITTALNNELEEGELFVNLASNEYFKAIDVKKLKVPVVTPVFKDFKNGEYKSIMTFAKFARGLMARYLIEINATGIDDIKSFDREGYRFSESLSNSSILVFTR